MGDYNLATISPNLFVQHSFTAWGKAAKMGLVYTYRNDRLGGDSCEQSHALNWNMAIRPARAWHTGLYIYTFVVIIAYIVHSETKVWFRVSGLW